MRKQGVEGSSKVHSGSRNEQAAEGTTEASSTDVWMGRVKISRAERNGLKWLWKLREQLGSRFVLGERSGCAGKGVCSLGWPRSCQQRNPKARARRRLAASAAQLRCAAASCPSCCPRTGLNVACSPAGSERQVSGWQAPLPCRGLAPLRPSSSPAACLSATQVCSDTSSVVWSYIQWKQLFCLLLPPVCWLLSRDQLISVHNTVAPLISAVLPVM